MVIDKVTKFSYKIGRNLRLQVTTLFYIFLLDVNFDKYTIGLYFLLISSILAKFLENKILIAMLLINYLNCKFL